MRKTLLCIVIAGMCWMWPGRADCAYDHQGDTDSGAFLEAYPDKAGTKLDSCSLCHTGGNYEKKPDTWVSLGSCQWCHYSYGYDKSGDIADTLNPYGRDYWTNGRNAAALTAIAGLDSDRDGFSNKEEIAAVRFPGNPDDDPRKVTAPYRIYSRSGLMSFPQHTQFQLMNTHKSPDFYAQYSGVAMSVLLDAAGKLPSATGILVFAPDGWSQYHPFEPDEDPLLYHVYGAYSQSVYYYNSEADIAVNPTSGWCEYSAPAWRQLTHESPIMNPSGLQMLLALLRDGQPLVPGELTDDNKLDGEGPFRVVLPQKTPGPPDQRSTAPDQNVIWPFDEDADHSAGFSTRTATIIKVEPMPDGTTDVDTLEAGWDFVDEEKLIIYGAIDPMPNILEKMNALIDTLASADKRDFRHFGQKSQLIHKAKIIKGLSAAGRINAAQSRLKKDFLSRTNGCQAAGSADSNDWIVNCELQKQLGWRVNELNVLLSILNP
jgi:hypothetical protein